jgi:hypothetical protein
VNAGIVNWFSLGASKNNGNTIPTMFRILGTLTDVDVIDMNLASE